MRSTVARIIVVTVTAVAALLGLSAVPGVAHAGTVDYYGQPNFPNGGKVIITSSGKYIRVVITGRRDALTGTRSCDVSLGNKPAKRVKLDRNGNGRVTSGPLRNGRYPIWGYCTSKTQRSQFPRPSQKSALVGPNRQGGYAAGVIVNGRPGR
ncbi:MAG: hypothetical protein QM662_13980 [Gordonia sp. (in: high G+C Gram-positive bacteria)]